MRRLLFFTLVAIALVIAPLLMLAGCVSRVWR